MAHITMHDDDEFDLSEAETYFAANTETESTKKRKSVPDPITPPGTKKQKCSNVDIQAATDECTRFLMDCPEDLFDDDGDGLSDGDHESLMAREMPVQASNLRSVTDEFKRFLAEHPEELLFNDSLHSTSINTKRKDAKDFAINLRGSDDNSSNREPTGDGKKVTGLEETATKFVNPPHCDKCLAEELKAIARGEFDCDELEAQAQKRTISPMPAKPLTKTQVRPDLSGFKYDPTSKSRPVARRRHKTHRVEEGDEPPASRRCLAIAELLERVILYLHPVDIFGVQRVNSLWRDTVLRSWPIRRKMHFVPEKFFVRAAFNTLVGEKCESKLSKALHPFHVQLFADHRGPGVSLTLKQSAMNKKSLQSWEEKFSKPAMYQTGSWRDILISESGRVRVEAEAYGNNVLMYTPRDPMEGLVTLGKVMDEARLLGRRICHQERRYPMRKTRRIRNEEDAYLAAVACVLS